MHERRVVSCQRSAGLQPYKCAKQTSTYRERDVERGRARRRVQMPVLLGHDVPDLVDADFGVLRRERDARRRWVPEDVQLGDLLADAFCEGLRGADDGAAGLEVAAVRDATRKTRSSVSDVVSEQKQGLHALLAHVLHRCPRSGDQ